MESISTLLRMGARSRRAASLTSRIADGVDTLSIETMDSSEKALLSGMSDGDGSGIEGISGTGGTGAGAIGSGAEVGIGAGVIGFGATGRGAGATGRGAIGATGADGRGMELFVAGRGATGRGAGPPTIGRGALGVADIAGVTGRGAGAIGSGDAMASPKTGSELVLFVMSSIAFCKSLSIVGFIMPPFTNNYTYVYCITHFLNAQEFYKAI